MPHLPSSPSEVLTFDPVVDLPSLLELAMDRGFPGTPLERSIVQRAARFAYDKHRTQVRKGPARLPYFVHLIEVGVTLAWADQDSETIAAGFLHDVKEDQGVTDEELVNLFGRRVARIVDEVTDVSRPADGNRATRKAMEREHLRQASTEGKNVKLADLTSNTRSIVVDDPNFATVYLKEKRLLLPILKDGAHPVLYQIACWAAGLGS